MPRVFRLLFFSDTHLGFDYPARPRVARRRRGDDFFHAYRSALEPAFEGKVDAVLHGGDFLFRSKVPRWLVRQAIEPILEVADGGTPVFMVPGNHERARFPFPLFFSHPKVYLFDRPRSYELRCGEVKISLAGFPFSRRIARSFASLLCDTEWKKAKSDIRILCMHQTVEGARVHGYTFRRGEDVIDGRQIPKTFAAVLTGHIHRAQMLTRDLSGNQLAAPVIYPGSTERTSFVERFERKGYALLGFAAGRGGRGRLVERAFVPLPTRPMVVLELDADGRSAAELTKLCDARLRELHPDSVVSLRLRGSAGDGPGISLPALRSLAPTMTIELSRNPRNALNN